MATIVVARRSIGSTSFVLAVAALVAWIVTILWIRADDMNAMPGTMGMGLAAFVVMWGVMMAAMMLPSVAPFIGLYERTITDRRRIRLLGLSVGYLALWAVVGVAAYGIADAFGALAADRPTASHAVAVATFVVVGVYQFTPAKFRCLSHCRSPIGHLVHYLGFRGPWRDVRAGASHGAFCLGCCWALMLLMIAFGVMNLVAMAALALVIAIEKVWRHGEAFARATGLACLVFAVLLVFDPSLAPGLDPDAVMPSQMQM